MIDPSTYRAWENREALYLLGYNSEEERRADLDRLRGEVEAKHLEVDPEKIAWGPWGPSVLGASSWETIGRLIAGRDEIRLDLVTSEDHEPLFTAAWKSNGREPAQETFEALRVAALEHADTAPTGHHEDRDDAEHRRHHGGLRRDPEPSATITGGLAGIRGCTEGDGDGAHGGPERCAELREGHRGDAARPARGRLEMCAVDGEGSDPSRLPPGVAGVAGVVAGERGAEVRGDGSRLTTSPRSTSCTPASTVDGGAGAGLAVTRSPDAWTLSSGDTPAGGADHRHRSASKYTDTGDRRTPHETREGAPTPGHEAPPTNGVGGASPIQHAAAADRVRLSDGARWIDHEDHPCSIRDHHAHDALGSSSLRRYLSDQQPTAKVGHLGNAVGWLATTPESRWSSASAEVVQRPNLAGHSIAEWQAENPGVIGLPAKEYAMAVAMATELQSHPRMRRILVSPAIQIEHTVLAKHAETGVQCKSRPDLRLPGVWLGDLKITRSIDLVSFAYSVGDYGYDAQAWLYSDIEASRYGLEQLRLGYDLIVVSETAPHRVGVWSMPASWLARGRKIIEAALNLRRIHLETGVRPPLWWETPQYLPGPSRTDRLRQEAIDGHVYELLRLRNRADARRGPDGADPGRRAG